MTKSTEYFDFHVEQGHNLLAASVAVDIARRKSARYERSRWLAEAVKLMPAWKEAARWADSFGKWEKLDAMVKADLEREGYTTSTPYQID